MSRDCFHTRKKNNRCDSYAEYRTLFLKPKTKKSEQYRYPSPLAWIRVIDRLTKWSENTVTYIGRCRLCESYYILSHLRALHDAPFWSDNGYTLCRFWSGIGLGFRVQFQMSNWRKRNLRIPNMFLIYNYIFLCLSPNLSNDNKVFPDSARQLFSNSFRILSNFFVREQLLATFRKSSTFLVTFGPKC